MRDGLRAALRLTGSMPARALERSPIVVAVDGMAAADLVALGVDPAGGGLLRRLDPRPPARRLQAAWRVGRLRSAFVELATDLIGRVDADLSAVPALDELANHELVAILRNGRRTLASLHGHEAIAGLLIPSSAAASVTGASLALSAVAQAHAEGVSMAELIERDPVVLALLAPSIGDRNGTDDLGIVAGPLPAPSGSHDDPDPAAVAREALRLRVRWLQELTARTAWELAHRLVAVEVLPSLGSVRLLTLDELAHAAQLRTLPADLDARREPTGTSLPSRFRLDDDGAAWAVTAPSSRRRRRAGAPTARPASAPAPRAGTRRRVARSDSIPPRPSARCWWSATSTRVSPRSSRGWARSSPRRAARSSHLAILAREYRVPTVVGVAGATTRFRDGERRHRRRQRGHRECSSTTSTSHRINSPSRSEHRHERSPPRQARRIRHARRFRRVRVHLPVPLGVEPGPDVGRDLHRRRGRPDRLAPRRPHAATRAPPRPRRARC